MARIMVTATLLSFGYGAIAANLSYPPPSLRCSSRNSTSWVIKNFAVNTNSQYFYGNGTIGEASFSIKNTANGYEFNCTQGSGRGISTPNFELKGDGKVWYTCGGFCHGIEEIEPNPPLDTSFSFDMDSKTLSVSQRWSCDFLPTIKTLLGSGSSVLSNLTCKPVPNGRPDQVSCEPINVTIAAYTVLGVTGPAHNVPKKSSPLPYTGLEESPWGYKTQGPSVTPGTAGCVERSRAATFIVDGIHDIVSPGILFLLTNTALNYTIQCKLQDSEGPRRYEAPFWRNCTRYNTRWHSDYPDNGIYTEVLYGNNRDMLGLSQTWFCNDGKKGIATAFSATASTTIRFSCSQTRSCKPAQGPLESPEVKISEDCNHPAVTLTPITSTSRLLTAEAEELFGPHGYNCSTQSLALAGLALEIRKFTFERSSWAVSPSEWAFRDYVEFDYNNSATGIGPQVCHLDRVKPDSWSECWYAGGLLLRELMTYSFDYPSKTLTLDHQWGCDAISWERANYFRAFQKVALPLNCSVGDWNETICRLDGRITVPITNLTKTLNASPEKWDKAF